MLLHVIYTTAFCTKLDSFSARVKKFTNVGKSYTFHYAQRSLLKHTHVSIEL